MSQRPFLLPDDPHAPFPSAELALRQPDGLLAMGGDLSVPRLLSAYRGGIFPWFSEGQPLLWWSPDPRTVFPTDGVALGRRFLRSLRTCTWQVRADTAFDAVLAACAAIPRPGQDGTWITTDMRAAYNALHRLGHAHSVEVFDGSHLVGGIYGVAIGQMFYGESMFSAASGGSKVAFASLAAALHEWGWPLIDAQVENPHLLSLGAQRWPRAAFLPRVREQTARDEPAASWTTRFGVRAAADLAQTGSARPG